MNTALSWLFVGLLLGASIGYLYHDFQPRTVVCVNWRCEPAARAGDKVYVIDSSLMFPNPKKRDEPEIPLGKPIRLSIRCDAVPLPPSATYVTGSFSSGWYQYSDPAHDGVQCFYYVEK